MLSIFLIELKDLKDQRIREFFRNDTIKLLLQLSENRPSKLQQEARQAYEALK